MPGFDRSGPMGQGSMTGRAQGVCGSGSNVAAGNQFGYGRGFACRRGFGAGFGGGRGMGRGAGFGSPFTGTAPAPQPVDEKEVLQNQASQLQQSLDRIMQRLNELEPDE